MKRAVLITALVACVATSKEPEDTNRETGVGECAAVPLIACESEGCTPLSARRLSRDAEPCVDYQQAPEIVGCWGGGDCPAVEVFASSPEDPDTCMLFSSGCIPAGWTQCDWVDYSECR